MILYDKSKYERLKVKFNECENIQRNYSQSYQDLFVLTMTNGKKNGTFVEIGANDPIFINNTYLLESQFGWNGISIDIEYGSQIGFQRENRNAKFILQDALTIDYKSLFIESNLPNRIDYLQIDIETQINTFNCLKRIPFDDYRFSVITFETDFYDTSTDLQTKIMVRSESREILQSYGYILIAGDICNIGNDPFEDWWVDPDVIDPELINKLKSSDSFNDLAEKIILFDE
jgi:hypothetical protein